MDGEVSDDVALHLRPGAVRPLVIAVDRRRLRGSAGTRPARIQGTIRRSKIEK